MSITHIKPHKVTIPTGEKTSVSIDIEVAEVTLVLVDCKKEESPIWPLDKGARFGSYVKPILISEIEKIEAGVDYMFAHSKMHQPDKTYVEITGSTKKVLALPDHFSPKHLKDIVDGVMKDGDKMLIECKFSIETLKGREYEIKLNSSNHITLHKVDSVSDKIDALMRKHSFNELIEAFKTKGCKLSAIMNPEGATYKRDDVAEFIRQAYVDGYENGYTKGDWHGVIDKWVEEKLK